MSQPATPPNSVRRLLVAVIVGVVVAVVSYLGAFSFLRVMFLSYRDEWMVHRDLKQLAATLEAHKERTGHYPTHLTDVEELEDALRHDDEGWLVDRWGHPYQYSTTADGFTLFSLGRDGQPGGEGDDADVYHDRPLVPPSFSGFMFDMPTGPILWACVLTGIAAAVVVGRPSSGGWGELLGRAAATAAGAILVAFIISVVHVPSGH